MQPEIKYAISGDVHIAYQIVGKGPIDVIYVTGFLSHLGYAWELPSFARFLQRLGTFSRLIWFDKRGTGLSDRVTIATLEQRMDDVRAVMDAAKSERAVLYGQSEGGPMAVLFSATYPERTAGLILYATFARRSWAPDYPWAPTLEDRQKYYAVIEQAWGQDGSDPELDLRASLPSIAGDANHRRWYANYLRFSASPGAALAILRMNSEIDIRPILPTIRVPTLVLHRTGDQRVHVEEGRYVASRIPTARFVELAGADHDEWIGDTDSILAEIEEFVTGTRAPALPDRALATVLFTDIVASTERAVALGDSRWRDLLMRHNSIVRSHLARFRGREVKTAGDGFLAVFDGPARAIHCARAICEGMGELGIEVRAGVHTGECEILADDVGGVAVHIGARVAALAGAGDVLVSRTVRDLVAGSGLAFADRGSYVLKGIPGTWQVFAVQAEKAAE